MKIIAALLLLALTGCVHTEVSMPNGVKLNRTAVLNKTGIGSLKFDPKTGAWELTGYGNDSTELAVAVTEAAVRASQPK